MAVLWAGWDVEHVAGPGLNRVGIEPVADVAGQDEDAVAGLAPVRLNGAARWVGGALLVAEGDPERRNGFANP